MSQALEKGIKQGISAESLGRQIRQYLNNPDMMYRRYHLKKAMADGTKRDVVEWRRRVIDEQGKVRFVKENLAHVGTGVYRSARQNALRLTIPETNMAYNYANCERWSSEPYVLGIRIRTSANVSERQQITQRRIFAMSLQATTQKISCGEAGTHVVAAPCHQS